MRLLATSDLHLRYRPNREALEALPAHPDDWLILAGDIGDTPEELTFAFETLAPRFAKLFWVPGNHELWAREPGPRGQERYESLVALARSHGVVTPEDPFVTWNGPGGPLVIALLFIGYDYSFGPDGYTPQEAKSWAAEEGLICNDERWLSPVPFRSREAWCAERLRISRARLDELPDGTETILVNHYPLRRDLVWLPRIPRFTIWCGTRQTEDWHVRYRARVVVSGHLHFRTTAWRDRVRFEEVSLGYPRHWRKHRSLQSYLRPILPGKLSSVGETGLPNPVFWL